MIPLTTARKATVAGAIAFGSPFYVLLQSEAPITWRSALACLVSGVIGYLSTYGTSNTQPVNRPRPAPVAARHAAPPAREG
ncbi:hypothetical protein [Blastococcus sp. SYSU D00813]